jgi:hypothetical protein
MQQEQEAAQHLTDYKDALSKEARQDLEAHKVIVSTLLLVVL